MNVILASTVTYTSDSTSGVLSNGGLLRMLIFGIAAYLILALGARGAYKKAGDYGTPAWSAFVPIYNFIVLLRIAGRPKSWAWFLLLGFFPVLSLAFFVVYIIVANDISKSFGHGGGFTVGLVLFGPIFWYILWLGSSQYRGPAGPKGSASVGYAPAGGSFGQAQTA